MAISDHISKDLESRAKQLLKEHYGDLKKHDLAIIILVYSQEENYWTHWGVIGSEVDNEGHRRILNGLEDAKQQVLYRMIRKTVEELRGSEYYT